MFVKRGDAYETHPITITKVGSAATSKDEQPTQAQPQNPVVVDSQELEDATNRKAK